MADLNTEFEYNKEVRAIAESIVDAAYNEYDEVINRDTCEELINDTLLHETIDSHQWVIYNSYNLSVYQYSANADYYIDNFGTDDAGEALKNNGLSGLHSVIAFWCMYADVQELIEEYLDKWDAKNEKE